MPGMHLILDGATTGFSREESVSVLADAADAAGMTIVAGPEAELTPDGFCAWTIIAESHIALHRRGPAVYCDVFSCKEFDAKALAQLLIRRLRLATYRMEILYRRGAGD